jgi:hypothetical protein
LPLVETEPEAEMEEVVPEADAEAEAEMEEVVAEADAEAEAEVEKAVVEDAPLAHAAVSAPPPPTPPTAFDFPVPLPMAAEEQAPPPPLLHMDAQVLIPLFCLFSVLLLSLINVCYRKCPCSRRPRRRAHRMQCMYTSDGKRASF